jgi:AAA+ superfamily predicted ATPase
VTSLAENGWFTFIDARLHAAVLAVAAKDGDPNDALRGLYISDEQALTLADDLGAQAIEAPLVAAADRLGLDALDAAVLAVCAAPELHPRYGRLYAYLQDDVTRRLPSPRLVAALLTGQGVAQADVLRCFAAGARLIHAGAVRVLEPDRTIPLADRPIKLSARLSAFLLGAGDAAHTDSGTVPLRRIAARAGIDGRRDAVEEVASALQAETRLPLVVCGPDAAGVLVAATGSPLVVLDVRELDRPGALADAVLASLLEGALLCFDGLERVSPADRPRTFEWIDAAPGRPVLLGRGRADAHALGDRAALLVEVPFPSFAERRDAWRAHTNSTATGDVAAKFRLSIAQIEVAAEVSMIAAHGRGLGTPEPADLDLGARHASSSRLGDLAARLTVAYEWDDLVLPERQRELLRSISAYLRHRDRVLSEWGYERAVARSQGLKVLFAGESGTGKTMAAQVLGSQLGLDLFRVDLATVVSKYIGETEQNLERIFTAADGSNAILFFDEADALFGKRSEVSDSHDRYANIEVAYLLQRMEAYPGAVILATNFKRNIDDAFIRRLDFVVDFPFPEAEDRKRIWQLVLPHQAPIAGDTDLDFLATQFKLSGGAIRNCSLAAAFRAADEDGEISMRHLVQAVAQEYAKQGRLTLEADFARFHELVRAAPNGR